MPKVSPSQESSPSEPRIPSYTEEHRQQQPQRHSGRYSLYNIMKAGAFFALSLGALYQTLFLFARAQDIHGDEAAHRDDPLHDAPNHADSILSDENDIPYGLKQILSSNSSKWTYPTAFTRNIVPRQLHSHNDYWRDVPYYSALSVGAISVEADIWLYNDTLYVGHEPSALTHERTLQSLYLDPIMDTLKRQNPTSAFISGTTHNGVFDTASTQTLYLWLDCKTSGESTFAAAIKALEPLHQAGWLSTYTPGGGVSIKAVTPIGTGNTPISYFEDSSKERYYFFDASLSALGDGEAQSNVTSDMSIIASTPLLTAVGSLGQNGSDTVFSSHQLSIVRTQIANARAKGIGARYWDTPGWPTRVRNEVWRTLWEEGVSLVNVDDLQDAAYFRW